MQKSPQSMALLRKFLQVPLQTSRLHKKKNLSSLFQVICANILITPVEMVNLQLEMSVPIPVQEEITRLRAVGVPYDGPTFHTGGRINTPSCFIVDIKLGEALCGTLMHRFQPSWII